MFLPSEDFKEIEEEHLCYFKVPTISDVWTEQGWVNVKNLAVGDFVFIDNKFEQVQNIVKQGNNILVYA